MNELSREYIEYNCENQKETNPEKMNFEELKELSEKVAKLTRSSFQKKKDGSGFINVNGDEIAILRGTGGIYTIGGISDFLTDFHRYKDGNLAGKTLKVGSADKEELMLAIRKMIEDLGCKVIE